MKICPWIWRVIHGRRPRPTETSQFYRPRLVADARRGKIVAFPADRTKPIHTPRRT